jgi:hypothetical protein
MKADDECVIIVGAFWDFRQHWLIAIYLLFHVSIVLEAGEGL